MSFWNTSLAAAGNGNTDGEDKDGALKKEERKQKPKRKKEERGEWWQCAYILLLRERFFAEKCNNIRAY